MATRLDLVQELGNLRNTVWNNMFDVISNDLKFLIAKENLDKVDLYNTYVIMLYRTRNFTDFSGNNVYESYKSAFERFDKLIKEYLGEITFVENL